MDLIQPHAPRPPSSFSIAPSDTMPALQGLCLLMFPENCHLWAGRGSFCASSFTSLSIRARSFWGSPLRLGEGAFLLPPEVSRIRHHWASARALSHSLSCSPRRTQGGVHVHQDGLAVTSPVLMWVQVSTGVPVPLLSPACLTYRPSSGEHLSSPSSHGEADSAQFLGPGSASARVRAPELREPARGFRVLGPWRPGSPASLLL